LSLRISQSQTSLAPSIVVLLPTASIVRAADRGSLSHPAHLSMGRLDRQYQ
jgi:hypothetical protein